MKVTQLLRRLLTVAALTVASSAFAQVAVVVNPSGPLASMTPEQIASVFMGKSSSLPNGAIPEPTDLPESNGVREQFYSKAVGKTPSQVKATWARLTFSGKATPPREMPSAAEVKKHVSTHPNAIGYIEKSAVDSSVKVVLTID